MEDEGEPDLCTALVFCCNVDKILIGKCCSIYYWNLMELNIDVDMNSLFLDNNYIGSLLKLLRMIYELNFSLMFFLH